MVHTYMHTCMQMHAAYLCMLISTHNMLACIHVNPQSCTNILTCIHLSIYVFAFKAVKDEVLVV